MLSAVFGLAILVANPPLRGPDEAAHFVRIYGIAGGDIIPATRDDQGRKGTNLPAGLNDAFRYVESTRHQLGQPAASYRELMTEYAKRAVAQPAIDARPDVFVLYEGAESYSPASYLPYLPVAWLSRALDLDFLWQIHLLRFVGFVVATALAAYAIAVVPHVKWAFATIALLPAALYGRTVLSTDGFALATVMVVTALCLRGALTPGIGPGTAARAMWMLWCALIKPPQIAFTLLEAMVRPTQDLRRRWLGALLVIVPGLILTGLWVVAVSGDAGTWRVAHDDPARAHLYDPAAKALYLLEHPLRFPELVWASLSDAPDLAWQLIGVLGWLDTPLRAWIYPLLGALLTAALVSSCPLQEHRKRVMVVAITAVVAYFLAVYGVFYLSWTAQDADRIGGVQGRYFLTLLPALAVAVAGLIRYQLPTEVRAGLAVALAFVSGVATLEAIVRVNW